MRWRLSGAWQAPTFVLVTIAEAVLLNRLPIAGDSNGLVAGFLFAGFANLALLAGAAPLAGAVLRRRHPELPRAIAVDRAGTTLMLSLLALFVGLGIAHHPSIVAAEHSDARALQAARRYLREQAPAEYARHVGSENVWKQAPDLYRTCVPGDDPHRNLCLFVDTSGPAAAVTVDPDQQPNSVVAGPDNPGRRTG